MTNMDDKLDRMMARQLQLQIESYGLDPGEMSAAEAIQYVHFNITALTDELHEALGETHWKPWAKGEGFKDVEAFKAELIDAWHFFMNLCLVSGMEPSELFTRYEVKRAINAQRQVDGYDGVTTKCPGCGRAMDDPDVKCHPVPPIMTAERMRAYVYCDRTGTQVAVLSVGA